MEYVPLCLWTIQIKYLTARLTRRIVVFVYSTDSRWFGLNDTVGSFQIVHGQPRAHVNYLSIIFMKANSASRSWHVREPRGGHSWAMLFPAPKDKGLWQI